jgi:hypothetical protein
MQRPLRTRWLMPLLLLVAVVVASLPPGMLLGYRGADLPSQFVPWRAFAVASLRAGHFPLWNPYTYAGEPFMGDGQSALLYPLNGVFLLLPLARAINFTILLHLALLGWGLARWAAQRGLDARAGAVGGAILVLGGAVFPHVYSGHLSNLCAMAWAPWILGGLERWWAAKERIGLFQASGAIGLQILAGHFQYVFFTGIAAGVSALVWTAAERTAWRRILPAVAACYLVGAALAAAQLWPGLAAAGEGVREARNFAFSSTFSFPLENFVTLFAPGFFGDFLHSHYWGRWYISEMEVFVGGAGVILILIGALGPESKPRVRRDLVTAGLLFLLALGAYTPLFRLLFDYVPGFGQIRGMSKFTFPATLFLVLVLAAGADAVLRGRPVRRGIAYFSVAAALVLALVGAGLAAQPEIIAGPIHDWQVGNQDYLPPAALADHAFLHDAGLRAAAALGAAAGIFLLLGLGLLGLGRRPWLRWVPLVLLAGETLWFTAHNFATMDLDQATPAALRQFLAAHPGDDRVLTLTGPTSGYNGGFLLGVSDLWGNNPSMLRRYAEFMTFSQGYNPDLTSQYLKFRSLPALYAMLRCRYVFYLGDGQFQTIEAKTEPMPRVQLISHLEIRPTRTELFATMAQPTFDPRRRVLLESRPDPYPVPSADPGSVRILDASSPDALEIEADVRSPTLLLVTDLYSRDWRATALPGSVQASYQLLPANYILRAVPLAAGHHHLRMEYDPPSFRWGLAVSALAGLAWLAGAAGCWRGARAAVPA